MSASPPLEDPYAALGVSKDATIEAIRSSYRKLVLRAHPDKVPATATAEEKQKKADEFHKIQKAYETIGDPLERQKHDGRVKLMERKAELMRERELFEKETRDRERDSASARRSARSQPGSGDYSNLRTYSSAAHDARTDYSATASFTVPMREARWDANYEERVPQRAPKRYEDDYVQYDSAARFEEVRFSPRSKDDSVKSTTKRASARDAFSTDDTRRPEDYDEKLRSKATRKAQKKETMKTHEADRKQRDKYRRQERETTTTDRTPKLGPTSDNSDSEHSARYSRRRPEAQTSRRTEESGRRSRREGRSTRASVDSDYSDDDDDASHTLYREKQTAAELMAQNYIRRHAKGSSDLEESARSSRRKERAGPPPAAPVPPPAPQTGAKEQGDKVKRSSASKKSSKETRESRESRTSPARERSRRDKVIEIVEEPVKSRRGVSDPTRIRPGLENVQSAPPDILERMIHSKTWAAKGSDKEPSSVRRAKTGLDPVQTRSQDRDSERDRGRSPVGTPRSSRRAELSSASADEYAERDYNTPTGGSFKYRVVPELDGMSSSNTPRIVPIEPNGRRSSRNRRSAESREVSPHNRRTAAQSRPSPAFGLGIGGIPRANTFHEGKSARDRERDRVSTEPESPRFPGPSRAATARTGSMSNDMFFGEVPPGASARDALPSRPSVQRSGTSSTSFSKDQIYWANDFTKNDIIYSEPRSSVDRSRHYSSNNEPRITRERSPLGREDHRDSTSGRRREGPTRSSSEAYIPRENVNRPAPSNLRQSAVASRA